MRDHNIMMQCGRVRLAGDLSKNPKVYEVKRSQYKLKHKRQVMHYACSYIKNGEPKVKWLTINQIVAITTKKDLDLVREKELQNSLAWKNLENEVVSFIERFFLSYGVGDDVRLLLNGFFGFSLSKRYFF